MKKTIFIITVFCFLVSLSIQAQDIIPKANSYKTNGEVFKLTQDIHIYYSGDLKETAEFLTKSLSLPTGWDFAIKKSKSIKDRSIFISTNNSKNIEKEGYELSVKNNSVKIIGSSQAGVLNGIQTLLQMLPVEIYNKKRQNNINWKITGA
ncbi:MAG: hypothetical protein DRJ07_15715, partial [Bacteroidetes bacterium]